MEQSNSGLSCTAKIENIQTGESEVITSPCAYTITADVATPGATDQTVITVRTPDSKRTVNLPIVNDTLHIGLSILASLLKAESWELQCIIGEFVESSIIPCADLGWVWTQTPHGRVPVIETIPLIQAILVAQATKSLNSGLVVAWLKDVMRGWLDEKMKVVGK